MIRRTLTTVRCVPRCGFDYTQVRMVSLEAPEGDEDSIRAALDRWFRAIGIEQAVFDVDADDNGFFAIVNDEAFQAPWGEKLL